MRRKNPSKEGSPLSALGGLVHGFILRHPDIDVTTDRSEALHRLEEHHGA